MSKIVVIARYKEDISWSNGLYCNKIIYNKFYEEGIVLPNVGKESHTYLTHIINNYDNLCDMNIFTQGNPIFHSASFVRKVNNLKPWVGFKGLSDSNFETNWNGLPHHKTPLRVGWYCEELLEFTPPEKWIFNGNGMFAVHKNLILRHKLDFYKKLFKLIYKDMCLPWILERLWHPLFKGGFMTKFYL